MAAIVLTKREKILAGKFLAAVVVLFFIPYGLDLYVQDVKQAEFRLKNKLSGELEDYSNRLNSIEDEGQLFRRFSESYSRWAESGYMEPPDLQDLLEKMQEIIIARKLYKANYNVVPRLIYDSRASKITSGSSVQLRIDRMKLDMPMLHDMDVFMFLEDYRTATSKLFVPVQCDLVNAVNDFRLTQRVNINASCTLDWITVEDPERKATGGVSAQAGGSVQESQS